ncbi:MAG: hypothetical protein AAGA32_21580 [Pseudomonadota bacterium]
MWHIILVVEALEIGPIEHDFSVEFRHGVFRALPKDSECRTKVLKCLMVRSIRWNGRKRYGPSSSWQRHDHARRQSSNTAIASFDRDHGSDPAAGAGDKLACHGLVGGVLVGQDLRQDLTRPGVDADVQLPP